MPLRFLRTTGTRPTRWMKKTTRSESAVVCLAVLHFSYDSNVSDPQLQLLRHSFISLWLESHVHTPPAPTL